MAILSIGRRGKIVYSIAAFFFLVTMPLYAQQSSPTDEIVVKATNAVIFQMTANLKLTQDQIDALQPIIADNIAKQRDLQQSLEDGTIDSSAMYSQRQQLVNDENQQLGSVLTPDQLRIWISMQNQSDDDNRSNHSSSK